MHQGGIVSTLTGEWWGFSMMDVNSVGRLTCLSPVTWRDGWPYFGLPGNLKRTPRTWVKPNAGHRQPPRAPYPRDDDLGGPSLAAGAAERAGAGACRTSRGPTVSRREP
jgi:beta-xylosidase